VRARLIGLVSATTSLVLVAFLVPLAMLVRTTAAERAVAAAMVEVQALAPIVAAVDEPTLELAVARANTTGPHRVTVFLPNGKIIGTPVPRSAAVSLAATGRSLNRATASGIEVLVAVAGLSEGTAVIRSFVANAELRRGVARAWLVLGLLGLGLLAVSALVADQLARSLTRPITALAEVSHRLAQGDLSARAAADGPPQVRQVGAGLNLLVNRIGELLANERESVADLSHRLRTPLTALRIDAEALRNRHDRSRITTSLDAVERTVNDVIRAARRPVREGIGAACDAAEVVTERVEFWSALAVEEGRRISVEVAPGPVPVRVSRDDLSDCVDALLGNVFAHTPEGAGFAVRLTASAPGGGRLMVLDEGPGLPDALVLKRGNSGAGSTGLGLDIVSRVAANSGGGVTLSRAAAGGAAITVELGAPVAPVAIQGPPPPQPGREPAAHRTENHIGPR
jgi:signal transduction histidine kinase